MVTPLTFSQVRSSDALAWHPDGYLYMAGDLYRAVIQTRPFGDELADPEAKLRVRRSSLSERERGLEAGWHHLEGCACAACAAAPGAQPAEVAAMFVQVAQYMTAGNDRVTLHGLSPATLFFSDRPQRLVGHVSTQRFVEEWRQGPNSFAADPPNAVLSFVRADEERPEDATLVIAEPRLDDDRITYRTALLEGSLPAQAESCALFIDPLGRPLAAVSLAGMHRRVAARGL